MTSTSEKEALAAAPDPEGGPTQESVQASERGRWLRIWLQRLERQLARMTAYVRVQLRQCPKALIPHQDSLITLLNCASPHPRLHRRMMGLIVALSPWPVRWGHGQAWEAMLRFALEVADVPLPASVRAALLNDLARLLFDGGRREEALVRAHEAVKWAFLGENPKPLGQAVQVTVDILRKEGELEAAYAMLDRAEARLKLSRRAGYEMALADLYAARATLLRQQGDLNAAIAWADKAVSLVEDLAEADPHGVAGAYFMRGIIHWGRGEYAETIRDMERAVPLYAAVGDRYAESGVLGVLGLAYWSIGDYVRAEGAIRQAMTIAEELNALQRLAVNVGNLGLVYLTRGDPAQALVYVEEHARLARQIGDAYELMRAVGNRGVVQIHLGEFGAALEALKEDARHSEQRGSREGRVAVYVNLARCLGGLGRRDEAVALARRALALAQDTGSATVRLAALRSLAEWLPPSQQEPYLREALHLARQTGRRLDEAACLLSLAAVHAGEERQRLWQQGVALLQEMEALAWVQGRTPDDPPSIPLTI